MSFPSTYQLDLQLQPGRPPMMLVDAAGDPAGWVADHRDALRAAGRESYQGPREVLVGMADAVRLGDHSPTTDGAVR